IDTTGHAPGDWWDPRSYDWKVAGEEALSIVDPRNYDWGVFASDLKENAGKRLIGIGVATYEHAVDMGYETLAMAYDVENLAIGRDVPLESKLGLMAQERLARGDSVGDIIKDSAIDTGLNLGTAGLYGTAKEYGSIMADYTTGTDTIEKTE